MIGISKRVNVTLPQVTIPNLRAIDAFVFNFKSIKKIGGGHVSTGPSHTCFNIESALIQRHDVELKYSQFHRKK